MEAETIKNFESIFRQHYLKLCSYANTFLKDENSSEDIVQEIFIEIWNKQKFQIGPDKIKFYLFTAVRNNCLTRLQKNKKSPVLELKEDDASDEINIRIDKEETIDPKNLIAKAMDQLPPKCREVFMLSRLSGHTYQQIANILGISVKTVENQMGKAIKMMKVFARENSIYMAMLCFLYVDKNIFKYIGVFMEKWFY